MFIVCCLLLIIVNLSCVCCRVSVIGLIILIVDCRHRSLLLVADCRVSGVWLSVVDCWLSLSFIEVGC